MIFFILLLLFGWIVYRIVTPKPCEFEHLKTDNGIKPISTAYSNYYGGFRDISAKNTPNIIFYMFKDKVRIVIHLRGKFIDAIDFCPEDILSISYMNERELTENISLGRILVFGWLGLAMKKKKEINREYIVLRCIYEDKKIDVVLNSDESLNNNKKCFETLNNYITEYKNRNKTIEV